MEEIGADKKSKTPNQTNTNDIFLNADYDPFIDMKISQTEVLDSLQRTKCPLCQASRKYFCYTCYCYMEAPDGTFPTTALPIKIDIIKHPKETDGKSTAVHAAVVASGDVKLYTYPAIPDYTKEADNILLLFPGPHSKPMDFYIKSGKVGSKRKLSTDDDGAIEEKVPKLAEDQVNKNEITDSIGNQHTPNASSPKKKLTANFSKIVMIDSTWNQSYSIFRDERLKGLNCVELVTQKTNYWRKQINKPDTYLATIEALYLFVKTYHETFIGSYEGEYDNLLFFFKYFYNMVKRSKSKKKVMRKS